MTTHHATLYLCFIRDIMGYEVLRTRLQVWTFARSHRRDVTSMGHARLTAHYS